VLILLDVIYTLDFIIPDSVIGHKASDYISKTAACTVAALHLYAGDFSETKEGITTMIAEFGGIASESAIAGAPGDVPASPIHTNAVAAAVLAKRTS
jgi:hypothetical protein